MSSNLFIPKKIKVGFQKREGTFTGKLAYIIYYDEKGNIRKEQSWETWRDTSIEAVEFDNTPRSGYLFNKGIKRDGYHWGSGRSVIRVYDPRDFEFEISVDNLIGILMHSDVSKRDIVEECIFAWEGKDLVLLPLNSEVYQNSVKFTQKLAEKLSARSLVKGYTYNLKRSDDVLTYIGYYDWVVYSTRNYPIQEFVTMGKKHIFYNNKSKQFEIPSISLFSSVNIEQVAEDYPSLVEIFFKSLNSQLPISYKIIDNLDTAKKTESGIIRLNVYKDYGGGKISITDVVYSDKISIFTGFNEHVYNGDISFTDEKVTYCYKSQPPIRRNNNILYWRSGEIIDNHQTERLKKIATEMGFDVATISYEDFMKVLKSDGYGGSFVFVLKDGTEIQYDL